MSEQNNTTENFGAVAGEICRADCSSCGAFPTPFRRIGESPYCRFSQHAMATGVRMPMPGDRMVRLLFLMSGTLQIEDAAGNTRTISEHKFVCLARGEAFIATAQTDVQLVLLSMLQRIEFCEQDIYDREMPRDTVVAMDALPMLDMHPAIERQLSVMFDLPTLVACSRYHRGKTSELFMMIKVLHSPAEHAYFFQSMIQPGDNFRVFVCNNYDKADSVADLAALAGMSLSVFKRRFAEHFNDSVYHWMMRQKALKVFADIRDGEDNTKVLMSKYGFKYYTQFSRFCKNYLQSTPAQLIATVREG